jgi:cell division protein ZapB
MEKELKALEEKVGALTEFCLRLRGENQQLRQDLAIMLNQNKQISEKVSTARDRLEALMRQIPD